jgi:serine/threonine-protein kinase
VTTNLARNEEIDVPSSLRVGTVVDGKYRVENVLGSGGMGVVMSAFHLSLGKRVAIKLLRAETIGDPSDAIARFSREARVAAHIQSEHVVRVMDVAALPDGSPYMVMEYLEGADLRQVVATRGPLPIEEAVDYVLQACEALAEAHAAGIIHRDLKPGNLFLQRRSNGTSMIKVLDFGISKLLQSTSIPDAALTTTNSLMGSPLYMSPEQMKSARDVDARADIWALGAILYELVAGCAPFGGATIPEVCIAVISSPPRALAQYRHDIPPQLQGIILRCLQKHAIDRYPSVAALARELTRFASERSHVHADRASAVLRAPTIPEAPPVVMTPPEPNPLVHVHVRAPEPAVRPSDSVPSFIKAPSRPSRSRRWLAVAIGLGALAGGIGAIVAHRPAPEPTGYVLARAPAPAPTASASSAEAPRATSDLASVPFEALPHAPVPAPPPTFTPASAPRGTKAIAPRSTPHAASAQPKPAPPSAAPAPAPSPAKPAAKSDDWKWGDRN